MADLSPVAANVAVGGSNTRARLVQFGETVTPPQPVYLKASDQKYWKADANASAEAAAAVGCVLTGGAADAYGYIVESGPLIIGATVTLGVPYIVSTNVGMIAPASDFAGYGAGTWLTHLGYAISTTVIDVQPKVTGASK